jgi:malonyl-CoA/methylmalonyl-CoA synthetase
MIRAFKSGGATAIVDESGPHTYGSLLEASSRVAAGLLDGQLDLSEARVCALLPANFHYVATQWGVWRAGGVIVPLCTTHPLPEIEYAITDSDSTIVVYHPQFKEFLNPIKQREKGRKFITAEELLDSSTISLPTISQERRAMILYTSGTTSRPKGVVLTHLNIASQITSLVTAWKWSASDRILNVLPLHHVHGIINVLSCALWSGAECKMLPKFDAAKVWENFVTQDLTLFMAVPTIYRSLITYWNGASEQEKRKMSTACQKFRLMVSGSAALPAGILEEWKKISGHTLLERYGMTEIGMALSNPLHGERKPGYVGTPLPGVEIKLVGDDGSEIPPNAGRAGEVYVKGPSVFSEYWRRPEITSESFLNGWFKTGDVAVQDELDGYFRILGRSSIDIIKTGGYKVSALEIEEVLRTHPAVKECAVVGVEDEYWGERVCAVLVLQPNKQVSMQELSEWMKKRIAGYKVPKQMQIIAELPRNSMGKVVKPELKKMFLPADKKTSNFS